MNHDYLYVVWKNPRSRRNYIIGKLTRGEKYTFEYCEDYKEAEKAGWELLNVFPEEKIYESDTLFAAFSSRLPDPKRRGMDTILEKYGLTEYDGYELLKKSTGRLPFDTYEFIDPIFPEEETVQRDFYKITKLEKAISKNRQQYEKMTAEMKRLLDMRKSIQSDELFKAYASSKRSYRLSEL